MHKKLWTFLRALARWLCTGMQRFCFFPFLLRQMEAGLALMNGGEHALASDFLGGVIGKLEIVCTCHHRGQVSVSGSCGVLQRNRKIKLWSVHTFTCARIHTNQRIHVTTINTWPVKGPQRYDYWLSTQHTRADDQHTQHTNSHIIHMHAHQHAHTSFRTMVMRGLSALKPPMGRRGLPVTNWRNCRRSSAVMPLSTSSRNFTARLCERIRWVDFL